MVLYRAVATRFLESVGSAGRPGCKSAETALAERAAFESLIARISAGFIPLGADDIDSAIEAALGDVCAFVGANAGGVALCDDEANVFHVTHAWQPADWPAPLERGIDVPYAAVPWFLEQLRSGSHVSITSVDDLPNTANGERAILEQYAINGAMAVPLMRGSRLVGYFNLSMRGGSIEWTDDIVALLHFLGDIFLNALERKEMDAATAFRAKLEGLLVDISAGFINLPIDQFASTIESALERMVRLVDGYTTHLFLYRERVQSFELAYRWSRQEARMPEGTLLPHSRVRWFWEQATRGQAVQLSSPTELPAEAADERAFLESYGCEAFVVVPLTYGGRVYGVLDLQSQGHAHAWPQEHLGLLRLCADVLLTAHIRREEEEQRRNLEAQFMQAQKMEAVGTLAGGIAHDFNNLLTGIIGGVELALLEADGPELTRPLERAREAATRATQVTRQLLSLTRREELRKAPMQVNELVERTARLLQRTVDATIDIRVVTDPEMPVISGDAGLVEQALLNLGINARDAMPRGGVLLFETLVLRDAEAAQRHPALSAGNYACIRVTDTGDGIPAALLEHIFEPFFTTKDPGKGTGLGLAMVHHCVSAHDGDIAVASANGETVFDLYLPLVEVAGTPRDEPDMHLFTGVEGVLLVDDEEQVLYTGRRLLERCGYAVTTAGNAAEALGAYDANPGAYRLVLTDLVMPGSGGRELLRGLRERDATVPVILMSGYGQTDDGVSLETEARRIGFTAFLPKPFRLTHLAQTVRQVLDVYTLGANPAA